MPGLGNFSLAPLPSPTAGVGMNLVGDLFTALAGKKQTDVDKQKLAAEQKQQADAQAQRLYNIAQQNPSVVNDKGWQSAVLQAQKTRGLPAPDFTQLAGAQTQGAPQGALAAGAPGNPTAGSGAAQPVGGVAPQSMGQGQQPGAQGAPAAANPQATAAMAQQVTQKIGQLLPYRQNPVAQKQIAQLVQQYGNILPPQTKQQIAQALQQPAGSQAQPNGPYRPNSIPNLAAGNPAGAPPTGGMPPQQGAMAAPGPAQAGTAPPNTTPVPQAGGPAQAAGQGVGLSILNTPQTPMTPAQIFSDANMSKMFNEATSDQKRAMSKALGVQLPEEYLALGPEYGPAERAQARSEVYMSLNNMANGTGMNAQTFGGWLQANEPTLQAAGMNIQSVMAMNPQVMQQLSATASAKIQEMQNTGLLKNDQAQALLAKLPEQLSNMRSLDDLRKFQSQYYGVRAELLPQTVRSQIAYRSTMADAAWKNANTHAAQLAEKIKEVQSGGGSMKAFHQAQSYVTALQGDARAADSEYQSMFRTAKNWQNNNPSMALPDDIAKPLAEYKKKAETARQVADSYNAQLIKMGPGVMSGAGLQGVRKIDSGSGNDANTVVGSDGHTYQRLPNGKWKVIQ